MKPVCINFLAETLNGLMDEWHYYLNRKTGEVVEIQGEHLLVAEEWEEDQIDDRYTEWELDCIREAAMIIENEADYVELPDKYEIHEYQIVKEFCYLIQNEKLKGKLCELIAGRGAFRKFKEAIRRYDLEDQWYRFKHATLCEIARRWCDAHHVLYLDDCERRYE